MHGCTRKQTLYVRTTFTKQKLSAQMSLKLFPSNLLEVYCGGVYRVPEHGASSTCAMVESAVLRPGERVRIEVVSGFGSG